MQVTWNKTVRLHQVVPPRQQDDYQLEIMQERIGMRLVTGSATAILHVILIEMRTVTYPGQFI